MLFTWIKSRRILYTLKHHPLPVAPWRQLMHAPLFRRLTSVEKARLRILATLFMHRKQLSGANGLVITNDIATSIAAQACLPVLHLDLGWYNGWVEVIIYPGAFQVERDERDETGLVSHRSRALAGESWLRGPVIVTWDKHSQPGESHHNVIIHEFAHKLDMQNGAANGMPPLHADMIRTEWTGAFTKAFEHMRARLAHHHTDGIDPYAAESPAEFFAVCSEYFFTAPQQLVDVYPAVYRQLVLFYRQDPVQLSE